MTKKKLSELNEDQILQLINGQEEKYQALATAHEGCAEKINDLQTELEKRDAVILEKTGIIENLNTVIGSANAQISKAAGIPTEAIEHDGKKFQWTKGSFQLPNDSKVYTPATADTEVVTRLLAIKGQKALKELV
jgi:hypothetical protein